VNPRWKPPQLPLVVERALAGGLLSLPRPALRALSGGNRTVVDGQTLDEQVEVLVRLAARMGRMGPEAMGITAARREIDQNAQVLAPRLRRMARIRDYPVGDSGCRVRLYVPMALADQRRAPALVFIHGGGWCVGSVAAYERVCRHLAAEVPCAVVSVDYRLAPEHKFPSAVEDAVASFRWVRAEASALGIDPERIAIGGDSAGGNLAAVVCQEQAAAGLAQPKFQLLVYPSTDMACSTRSHHLFAKGFLLDRTTIDWFIGQYTRTAADRDDPRASPLRATSLAGQPPALILVAGFDPLRDEGCAYAEKLTAAGVRARVRNDTGMFHGYFATSGTIAVAKHAMADVVRTLAAEL
jgi:acetyl esterase